MPSDVLKNFKFITLKRRDVSYFAELRILKVTYTENDMILSIKRHDHYLATVDSGR